jgi:hypothetical protein
MYLMMATLLAFEIADIGTTRALFAIFAITIILFILNRSARRRRLGGNVRPDRSSNEADTARVMRLKREMEQLLVELNEFAREVNGQVDTRFAKLERSIADADRRIAELQRLRGESGKAVDTDDSVLRANREAADGVRARLSRAGSAPSVPAAHPSRATQTVSREDAVYQMSDAGKSLVDIARFLKCTVGEVELILNLRDRS